MEWKMRDAESEVEISLVNLMKAYRNVYTFPKGNVGKALRDLKEAESALDRAQQKVESIRRAVANN